MKTKILAALLIFAAVSMAFMLNNDKIPNAVVRKVNQVDVYIYSEPIVPYDTIKDWTIVTVSLKGIEGLVNAGTTTAVKEGANGIIINARNGRAQAIKYK